MLKNKIYYQNIFDKLIPRLKEYNSLCFSDCVDVNKFFKNLKFINLKAFNIISKKKCNTGEIINLLGDYIIESYFLSKRINKKLLYYEKRKIRNKSHLKEELNLLNKLKRNGKKKL